MPSAKISNVGVSNSALEVWDRRAATYAVSKSSGNVKASAGVLFGWIGTTAGTFDIKDGNTSLAPAMTVSANVAVFFPIPISFTTNISLSASAAVATLLYL